MLIRAFAVTLLLVLSTQIARSSTTVVLHFTNVENQVKPYVHIFRTPSQRHYFTIDGNQVIDNNAGYVHQLRFGETFSDENKLHHTYQTAYRINNNFIYKDVVYPGHHIEVIRIKINRNETCSASVRFSGLDNGRYTDYDSAGTFYEDSSVHAEDIVCTVQNVAPQS